MRNIDPRKIRGYSNSHDRQGGMGPLALCTSLELSLQRKVSRQNCQFIVEQDIIVAHAGRNLSRSGAVLLYFKMK